MPWLRAGDNAATYPSLMMVAVLGDERTVNEVKGWLTRCMETAAGHTTDYLVDMGTATLFGGSRTAELIRIASATGLIVGEREVNGIPHLELVDDPEFLHMRTAAELKAERQRKNDNTNPLVTASVRLRDGDQCRWCGVVTSWGPDRKSGRAGTYDHLVPVTKTAVKATADTLVVACRSCNSSRQDDREGWERPLLDPPSPPHYSKATAEFISKHLGITVVIAEDLRTGSQPVIAKPSGPAASRGSHSAAARQPVGDRDYAAAQPRAGDRAQHGDATASPSTADRQPAGDRDKAAAQPRAGDRATDKEPIAPRINRNPVDPRGEGSGFTGSGRDGPGRAGVGLYGSDGAGGRRSRRGRRRRPS